MSTGVCVLCRTRPSQSRRACPECVIGLIATLAQIDRLWNQLVEEPDPLHDTSRRRVKTAAGTPVYAGASRAPRPPWLPPAPPPVRVQLRHHDPVANALAAALVAGDNGIPRVSGTYDAPLPVPVDALDLALPAPTLQRSVWDTLVPATAAATVQARRDFIRFTRSTDEAGRPTITMEYVSEQITGSARQTLHRGNGAGRCRACSRAGHTDLHSHTGSPIYTPAHDQTGHTPAAALLDSWVRAWWDRRGQTETMPAPTVPAMLSWLAHRTQDAVDGDDTAGDFAEEMHELHRALRNACGEIEPPPEVCYAVPCRRCDLINVLVRRTDGSGYTECRSCGLLLTTDEYHRWVGLCAQASA